MNHETHADRSFPLEPLTVEHLRNLDVDATSHPRGLTYLSAASGMVWHGDQVIVAADDEHHIGMFDIEGHATGRLLRVLPGDLPQDVQARKKLKPDTEALLCVPPHAAWPAGALLAVGSGSRPNRQTGLVIPLHTLRVTPESSALRIDLSPLYAPLHAHFADLNIEGAFACGDMLLLLQRGNTGAQASSASIAFSLIELTDWLASRGTNAVPRPLRIQQHDLPRIGEVPLSFTDGTALSDGNWLFSAVAENTDNSYADGVCVGAAIGIMNADGTLRRMWALPAALKVEGVAAKMSSDAVTVLMTTDADDPACAAQLLRARLR